MSWASKTQIATSLSVAGTEQFSSSFTLSPGESAQVQVKGDFPASPTDDLLIKVYGTLDDSSEEWDKAPLMQFRLSKGTDPNVISFLIQGFYKARLGFIRSGSTDTITTDAWIRKDGISL
jgi:hypothetical protein